MKRIVIYDNEEINLPRNSHIIEEKDKPITHKVPAILLVFPWVSSAPKSLAIPKSEIFGFISLSNNTLLHLRSRCMILRRESS